MAREERKKIIQEIEKKRESKVITYITSDRRGLGVRIAGDVVSLIHKHILALNAKKDTKLDLLLYSRGGQSDVPWTIVSMFREYCKKGFFSVLIPYRAHSAATVIALGADEIAMTKKAELGPIDITIEGGPYNPIDPISKGRLPISVEDVSGFFSLLEKLGCRRSAEQLKAFETIASQVHPLALGSVSRLLEQTKLVAFRLLSTRAKPFKKEVNEEIIKRISSEIYSHNHTISRTEALKNIGLKQVKYAEDYNIDEDLWALYEEYNNLFSLEDPFRAEEHLVANNLEENTWNDLNLACIESVNRLDLCQQTLRVRRLRQVPPQVNLTLNNIAIPAINIPNLPTTINQQQINMLIQQAANAIIQQTLNNAAQAMAQQFLRSLPQKGFERVSLDSGWRENNTL